MSEQRDDKLDGMEAFGIELNGHVVVKSLEDWHRLGRESFAPSHVAPNPLLSHECGKNMVCSICGSLPIASYGPNAREGEGKIEDCAPSTTRRSAPSMDDLADGWSSWDWEERALRAHEKGEAIEKHYIASATLPSPDTSVGMLRHVAATIRQDGWEHHAQNLEALATDIETIRRTDGGKQT